MTYIKGQRGYWFGKKKPLTQETKDKISRTLMGHLVSMETRKKIGLIHVGNKYSVGLKRSQGTKEKISQTLQRKGIKPKVIFSGFGQNNPRWIEDRTQIKISDRIKNDPLRKQWTKSVYIRDNWKCKIANQDCHGRIEAHHILTWKDYPELRYEINNGITLCHAHHPQKKGEVKELEPIFQALIFKK